MYLLDTDILLHLWQGNQSVKERLLEADDTEIAITAITKSEILRARCENLLKAEDAAQILKAQQRFTLTERLLETYEHNPMLDGPLRRFLQTDHLSCSASACAQSDAMVVSSPLSHNTLQYRALLCNELCNGKGAFHMPPNGCIES